MVFPRKPNFHHASSADLPPEKSRASSSSPLRVTSMQLGVQQERAKLKDDEMKVKNRRSFYAILNFTTGGQ